MLFFFFCFINWDKKKEPPRGEPYVLFLGKWNEKKSHCITIKISNSTQKVSSSSKIVSIVNLEVIMVPDLVMVCGRFEGGRFLYGRFTGARKRVTEISVC